MLCRRTKIQKNVTFVLDLLPVLRRTIPSMALKRLGCCVSVLTSSVSSAPQVSGLISWILFLTSNDTWSALEAEVFNDLAKTQSPFRQQHDQLSLGKGVSWGLWCCCLVVEAVAGRELLIVWGLWFQSWAVVGVVVLNRLVSLCFVNCGHPGKTLFVCSCCRVKNAGKLWGGLSGDVVPQRPSDLQKIDYYYADWRRWVEI